MKDNADYTVLEEKLIPITGNVLRDQVIQFNGFYAHKKCPHPLRRVVVWDSDNEREIVLLTNISSSEPIPSQLSIRTAGA